MSYESEMLKSFKMPSRSEVEKALLEILYMHNGVIKEFGSGEEIVEEIADNFGLTKIQRDTYLETIYRKENRIKKSYLWHRLLFRAADSLANNKLITRPTETQRLTNKKEWMLTEKGIDATLKLLNIPIQQKEFLPIKSFEVQKIVNKIKFSRRPKIYNPIDEHKKSHLVTREAKVRKRGFRLAVIEAYNNKCAFCGMILNSPGSTKDSIIWEVEAAHIVPYRLKGKDDIWNGLALCHLHHWAFDVGWFSLSNDYSIQISPKINSMPENFGKFGNTDFLRSFIKYNTKILLPDHKEIYPHQSALTWHRENIFHY